LARQFPSVQEESKTPPLAINYDSSWIEEQARSAISDEAFGELLDDLSDNKKAISSAIARKIYSEFKNFRKALSEVMANEESKEPQKLSDS
jgi:hypothetical protein